MKIKQLLESEWNNYLENLENLVNIESPTDNKDGVDQIGSYIINQIKKINSNYKIKVFEEKKVGNHILITREGNIPGEILVLGHMDTVFSLGTLNQNKFRIEDNLAFGPGVGDMKHGISSILTSLKIIDTLNKPIKTINIFLNSDEETGSENSRYYIEKFAQNSDLVIIMESGGENGEIIVKRKGISRYTLKSFGKSAHSGASFKEGRNAIIELSKKILKIYNLTNFEKEITINVGVIKGGEVANIIPEYAEAIIDVRCSNKKDIVEIDKKIKEISLREVKDFRFKLEGGINRPPLEKNEKNNRLYNLYNKLSKINGKNYGFSFSGGGTDGNFTSSLGIPTIDGLAPISHYAHTNKEYLELNSVIPKTEIFIRFLYEVSKEIN